MPRNTAIFEPTFRGTAIVRSPDILADPRYGKSAPHFGMPKGHLPVRSYLAVPVTARTGEVLGVVRAGQEGMPVGRLQSRLDIAASTLSHHLKALVGVGLVSQTREGTTLICHTNYDMMRGLIDYMVEECCAEGTCAPATLSKMPKVA